jgi:hypothetical protein
VSPRNPDSEIFLFFKIVVKKLFGCNKIYYNGWFWFELDSCFCENCCLKGHYSNFCPWNTDDFENNKEWFNSLRYNHPELLSKKKHDGEISYSKREEEWSCVKCNFDKNFYYRKRCYKCHACKNDSIDGTLCLCGGFNYKYRKKCFKCKKTLMVKKILDKDDKGKK